MKKQILLLTVLVLTLFLLVGCFSETSQSGTDVEEIASEQKQSISQTELKVPKTSNGFYHYEQWRNEMYITPETSNEKEHLFIANLTYIDYASGIRTYLCSVPGCLHNDESCTSFIRYPRGLEIFSSYDESELYIVTSGYQSDITSDEMLGRIYICDNDGANRKEIYKLPANESFETPQTGQIIIDKDNIYIAVAVTVSPTEMYTELRQINVRTGEAETLFDLEMIEGVYSAFDDKIITINYDGFQEMIFLSSKQKYNHYRISDEQKTRTTINTYSVTDKTKHQVFEQPMNGGVVAENYHIGIVQTSDDFGILEVDDLKTGEKTTIENIPMSKDLPGYLSQFYNGKIAWEYTVSETVVEPATQDASGEKGIVITTSQSVKYAIDIDSGEITEITLQSNVENFVERPLSIAAEGENEFLVALEVKIPQTKTMYGIDGVAHTFEILGATYGLIDKQDYYANVENYRIIEDLI